MEIYLQVDLESPQVSQVPRHDHFQDALLVDDLLEDRIKSDIIPSLGRSRYP